MKTADNAARDFVNGFFGMVEKAPRGEAMVDRLTAALEARDAEHAQLEQAQLAAGARRSGDVIGQLRAALVVAREALEKAEPTVEIGVALIRIHELVPS